MDTKLVEKVTDEYKKVKHPDFSVGDIIEVHTKIKEAGKERIQIFKGIVLAIKGKGITKTFTVRKISYGIGVEKIFPFYSPVVAKIKVIKTGNVRRSKLYFLRKRVGKAALKAGVQIPAEGKDLETEYLEEEEEKAKEEESEAPKEEKKSASSKEENSEKKESEKESKDSSEKESTENATKEKKSGK